MARITRSTSAKCAEQAAFASKAGPSHVLSPIPTTTKKAASVKTKNPLKPPMASVRVTRSMSKSASPPIQPAQLASNVACDTVPQSSNRKEPATSAQYISIEIPKRISTASSKKSIRHEPALPTAEIPQKSVRFASNPSGLPSAPACKNAATSPHGSSCIVTQSQTKASLPLPLQAVAPYSSTRSRRNSLSTSSLPVASKTVSHPLISSAKGASERSSNTSRPSSTSRRRTSPIKVSPTCSDDEYGEEDDDCLVVISGPCTAAIAEPACLQLPGHTSRIDLPKRPCPGQSVKIPMAPYKCLAPARRMPVKTSMSLKVDQSAAKTQNTSTSTIISSSHSISPRKARKSRRRARSASADPTKEAAEEAPPRSTSPEASLQKQNADAFTASSSLSKQARPKKALPARSASGVAQNPTPRESTAKHSGRRVTRSRSSSSATSAEVLRSDRACDSVSVSAVETSTRKSSRKRKCSLAFNYDERDDAIAPSNDPSSSYSDSDDASDSDCSSTSEPRKRQRRKRRSTSKAPTSGKVELLCPSRIKKAISDVFKAPKFLRWNPHLSQQQIDGLKHPNGPEWPKNDPVFHPFVSPKKELGHGQKRIDGVKYSMHRLSFAAHNGKINSKMDVSHVMDCGVGLSGRNINALHLTQESNDDNQVRKGHHRIMQLHAQTTTDSCFGLHIETRCRKWDKSRVSREAQDQLDELVQEELRKMKPAKGK